MLRFFSKIRYQLATENKVGRYLRYAVGEILLVVIGILIALQLNIANEKHKNKEQVREYLLALNKEIDSNIDHLNETLDRNNMLVNLTYHYLTVLNTDDPEKVKDSTITNMTGAMAPQNSGPLENAALVDLINSGLIKSIENDTLAIKIFKIQRRLDEYLASYRELTSSWENQLSPYLILNANITAMIDSIDSKKLPPVHFSPNKAAFVNNREFSNILMTRLILNFRTKLRLTETKHWMSVLNDEIDEYLANH